MKLLINYTGIDKPQSRQFNDRAAAQSTIDELYGNSHIDRGEWSRLFDLLSEPAGLVAAKPAEPELAGKNT